jgi:hypothetical protein
VGNKLTAEREEEIRRMVGDPKLVAGDLRRFEKAAAVFSSDHPRLIEQYPQQWVAVYDGEMLAARSIEDLYHELEERGIAREHAIIRFVDRTERVLIL